MLHRILLRDETVFCFRCGCFAYLCVYSLYVCLVLKRRVLDPVKLELKIFVSHHVGCWTQIQLFWKSNSVFNLQVISAMAMILSEAITP